MGSEGSAHVLSGLRDVAGVHGSFVLSNAGGLVGRDLPAVFQDELLEETGPRIVRLCEALEHGGEALENLVVRFTDHKLHIRRSRGGLLCVIADASSNAPALKMALALVARRVSAFEPTPPALSEQAPSANRPTLPAAPEAKKQPRFYRGARID